MALKLTAEHKSILKIFSGTIQYVIPAYQRSYSWKEEHCLELLEDLKDVYKDQKEDGYFLGNIVIAKSIENPDILEVIDGQQRLTTLTLLMKVLLSFESDSKYLNEAIMIPAGSKREKKKPRLITNDFIGEDAISLEEIRNFDFDKNHDICKNIQKQDSQHKKNICYFYEQIKEMKIDDIYDFIDFLLKKVTLLPIEAEDTTQTNAREKALKIFETINNRGKELEDSDIFKAKLYAKALSEDRDKDFIKEWKELEEDAKELSKPQSGKYTINDIFRFYTQIIRGENKIVKSEKGLREFFTQQDYSPFKKEKMTSRMILDDLFHIIDIIRFFREVIENPNDYKELSKWFQLIEQYSNQYPLYTLVVYIYVHGKDMDRTQLILFSKKLVQYSFSHGATTKIKFQLFSLISKIVKDKEKDFTLSFQEKTYEDLKYFGLLKKGFTLLAFYLNDKQEAIFPHYFNKIINSRDVKTLNSTWNESELSYTDYSDTLGNMIIIDKTISRDVKLIKKAEYLKDSSIEEIKELSTNLNNWSYQDYIEREELLTNRLKKFFEKINEN